MLSPSPAVCGQCSYGKHGGKALRRTCSAWSPWCRQPERRLDDQAASLNPLVNPVPILWHSQPQITERPLVNLLRRQRLSGLAGDSTVVNVRDLPGEIRHVELAALLAVEERIRID